MNWIFLAVGAQFLNAIVAVVDKQIVSNERRMLRPFVYAFYTCLISGAWILVYLLSFIPLPLDVIQVPQFANIMRPTLEVVALSFLAAYTFFIGLVSMFTALQKADASDVVPVIGATSAIASFGLGYFFLAQPIAHNFIFGIFLLALGTFLVSRFNFTTKTALISIHAGIFFALHYVAIKGLFLVTPFDNAFFWSRIAFVFFALSLLMVPVYFEKIAAQTQSATKQTGLLILLNKLLAGVSTILILKATDFGDVAVVQALGGLQFVFILLIGIFFTTSCKGVPCEERYSRDSILQKAVFVAIITLGFLILFK